MKHIIWTNDLDYNDMYEGDFEQLTPDEKVEAMNQMYETNDEYLNDERANLDIKIEDGIICIAKLGLWNGNFDAYKIIKSDNVKDCLETHDDIMEWFVEDDEFKGIGHHHDGTNTYLYRKWKRNVSDEDKDYLFDKILQNAVSFEDINRVTESFANKIKYVYGWE